MSSAEILRADIADAPAILQLQLQRQAYQAEALLYDDWTIAPLTQTLAELQQEFEKGVVLKALVGEVTVGSVRARIEGDVVHIGQLIVAPDTQRQGIGSALLAHIERTFPRAERFELFTGKRSEGNIRLYRRHGYSPTHEKVLSPSVTLVYLAKPNT